MNRFLVFAGEDNYPDGGMRDCIGKYASLLDAFLDINRRLLSDEDYSGFWQWLHIHNGETGELVFELDRTTSQLMIERVEKEIADLKKGEHNGAA